MHLKMTMNGRCRSVGLPVAAFLCLALLCALDYAKRTPDLNNVVLVESHGAIVVLDGLIADKGQPLWAHPFHMTSSQGCKISSRLKSHSQSGEDIAIFNRYFSKPLRCNGTFVELGALNGVRFSNTLLFEKMLGWNGVLIEGLPENAAKLMRNRPKTTNYAMAVCKAGSGFVEFAQNKVSAVGGIIQEMNDKHVKRWFPGQVKTVQVACAPLGELLRKAGVQQIDFVSLDVEGAELSVLMTMDWDIPVRVWVIEMGHDEDDEVEQLMMMHGYKPSEWDIQSQCPDSHRCMNNKVFENANILQ